MKKVIIIATIALSMVSNAASIRWIMTGITEPETSSPASGYATYLFASSISDSLKSTYAVTSKDNIVDAIKKGLFDSLSTSAIATGATSSGKASIGGIGDFKAGDSITVYSIVFDASSFKEATAYAISATDVKRDFTSSTGTQTATWTNFSSVEGQGWNAIPEPTSGLMLLLGAAGLALKRKYV